MAFLFNAVTGGAAALAEATTAVAGTAGTALAGGAQAMAGGVRSLAELPSSLLVGTGNTKTATVRITTGSNIDDGNIGPVRVVIVGDGRDSPYGPRAPILSGLAAPAATDGFSLGLQVMWAPGSTVSVPISGLPRELNPAIILLYNDSAYIKWFVKTVVIETTSYLPDGSDGPVTQFVFPCFSYIPSFVVSGGQARIIFVGNSRLPFQTPATLARLYRERSLDYRLDNYKFEEYSDLSTPSFLLDRDDPNFRPRLRPYPKRQQTSLGLLIPLDDFFDTSKDYDFVSKGAAALSAGILADPLHVGTNVQWTSVADLVNGLFRPGAFKRPLILSNGVDWRSDKEYGRQTLAGVHPVMLKLVTAMPAGFNVTATDLGGALPAGLTLQAAVTANRIFMTDYTLLEPFLAEINKPPSSLTQQSKYQYAPRCLFFRDDQNDVIPIAVQLERGGKVYTRANDTGAGKWQWTLAKAYVASADSGVHQVGTHFLNCHAVCEVYLIALRRNVCEWHPLFKLLIPHFRFTMAINLLARKLLINAGGIIEQCFTPGAKSMAVSAELFKSWTFKGQALPENLKARGVYDKAVLPYYPFRDHGMLIWDAIKKYVTSYLKIYYGDGAAAEAAIAKDWELQRFWTDVKYGNSRDVDDSWPPLKTLDNLAVICATMMWTASSLHAAVNFSQYDFSAFVPNHPASCRKPMPAQVDERAFMDVMPLPQDQIKVMSTVDLLSTYSDAEEYIGRLDQVAYGWLVDPAAQEAYKQFSIDLDAAEVLMKTMNAEAVAKGRLPYTYLYPRTNRADFVGDLKTPHGTEGIPNSVSI